MCDPLANRPHNHVLLVKTSRIHDSQEYFRLFRSSKIGCNCDRTVKHKPYCHDALTNHQLDTLPSLTSNWPCPVYGRERENIRRGTSLRKRVIYPSLSDISGVNSKKIRRSCPVLRSSGKLKSFWLLKIYAPIYYLQLSSHNRFDFNIVSDLINCFTIICFLNFLWR